MVFLKALTTITETDQKLAVQCANRSAHGGVAEKLAARCDHVHNRQLVFQPLHHMLTYLHITQPAFDQFRHLFTILYTILELWQEQRARKNTGGGATHNSKFILNHTIYL